MPEFPDLEVYRHALQTRLVGQTLTGVRLGSPFVLRSVEPPLKSLVGAQVLRIERIQKRLLLVFENERYLVVHLMIAGRLQWKAPGFKLTPKTHLAAFDFANGTLLLTEVSTKKRASIHVVQGADNVSQFHRGGVDVMSCSAEEFENALRKENHTLKRTLTDPRLFSAIGNAYSDEILHRAKLSPVKLTKSMTSQDIDTLRQACQTVLQEWLTRLLDETKEAWPTKVTAFRAEMAVHGKYKQPCPVCGASVQRIRHAENETNYCPKCQNQGRLLADRSLSKLLKDDWPKRLDELEEYVAQRTQG